MSIPLPSVIARWLFFCASMASFGATLFPLYAGAGQKWGSRAGRLALQAVAVLTLCCAIAWLVALARNLDADDPIIQTVGSVLFATSFGPSWIARLALCAAAVIFALAPSNWPPRRWLLVLAAAGVLICEGFDGHAVDRGWRGELVQAVHVLCAGAWFGGLFPLAALLWKARRGACLSSAKLAVRRFSNIALGFVAAILLTGVANVLLLHPGLALDSAYAKILALKVSLVAAMLAFATYNRGWLAPKLDKEDQPSTIGALLRSIMCEQALGAAVLLAVAALGLMNPYSTGV